MLKHSCLLEKFKAQLTRSAELGPILDLACGTGRNGIYLVENALPVVFADADEEALAQVRSALPGIARRDQRAKARLWRVDFEADRPGPLDNKRFGGIMVFRYLHRPLMTAIRQAVAPGGIVIYETFTVDQPVFGRPHNPDFLLCHDELKACFGNWDILH